jgi:hypothetical protein
MKLYLPTGFMQITNVPPHGHNHTVYHDPDAKGRPYIDCEDCEPFLKLEYGANRVAAKVPLTPDELDESLRDREQEKQITHDLSVAMATVARGEMDRGRS